MVMEGEKLWTPRPDFATASNIAGYQRWLKAERDIDLPDYAALWQWSVSDLQGFWSSIWDYFDVQSDAPYSSVLVPPGVRTMQTFGSSYELPSQLNCRRSKFTPSPPVSWFIICAS